MMTVLVKYLELELQLLKLLSLVSYLFVSCELLLIKNFIIYLQEINFLIILEVKWLINTSLSYKEILCTYKMCTF